MKIKINPGAVAESVRYSTPTPMHIKDRARTGPPQQAGDIRCCIDMRHYSNALFRMLTIIT